MGKVGRRRRVGEGRVEVARGVAEGYASYMVGGFVEVCWGHIWG
jgi:hypothetical protein